MQWREPAGGISVDDPIDRLIIQLRAYVATNAKSGRSERRQPSKIAVVFDTETTADHAQRLRFGAYQVRQDGALLERGLFYAEDMPADDLAVLSETFAKLRRTESGERLNLRTRGEFVEEVLYQWGLDVGAVIIGFNLPFDISRIATSHTYAKGDMKGGFSFTLASDRPNLRVKHLSQRASFISFAGKDGNDKNPDRGFFVDVKTLAAALTSASHSLGSLAKLLKTTPKIEFDDFDGPLTPNEITYGLNDVQVTWECFEALTRRFASFGLSDTEPHDLYSEASLGKAYLQSMGIKPWREAQPRFPPELIGQIMSTYYGGRAEVHIRREITPVIHCDFRSMYPTVCTLMGLWRFVIAQGMSHHDATDEVRALVADCTLDQLRDPAVWRGLSCIVQVQPDDDVFPVRATYDHGPTATIGLNRLTASEPMWFTLPDVLASKVLTGRTPKILAAVRFAPGKPQAGLRPIRLEGEALAPMSDDFYRRLIDQRGRVQAQEKEASEADRQTLAAASQSLKILANSTSYGIFVELNVQSLDQRRSVVCYDHRGKGRRMSVSKLERPGRYFHPLLGTLITGAARLMLGLAERNALDQGLSWAFCDTDSLAIANTAGLRDPDFTDRVEKVREWFEPLNPYEIKGSILQLEKVNFPPGRHKDAALIRPTNCLAISAKRYVLFDRAAGGEPVIRKASAHGLGHLLAPCPDPERGERIGRLGVELWQEDLWREIIAAFDRGHPDQVDFGRLRNFDQPAASRYAATNQTLLKWFDSHNKAAEPKDRVQPFNFLLSYQAKSRVEMSATDPDALSLTAWRRRTPNPASRYSRDLNVDPPPVFDRKTGETIPWTWLKSVGRSLARHHLHPEMKFRGGEDDQRGVLERRHVHAVAVIPIGKEADQLEEREALGDGDDSAVQWSMAGLDRQRITDEIQAVMRDFGVSARILAERARVSHHTVAALLSGRRLSLHSLIRLFQAGGEIRSEKAAKIAGDEVIRQRLREIADEMGSVATLAVKLGVSRQYLGRVIRGEKAITEGLVSLIFPHSDIL